VCKIMGGLTAAFVFGEEARMDEMTQGQPGQDWCVPWAGCRWLAALKEVVVRLRQAFDDHVKAGDREGPELWEAIDGIRRRIDSFQMWLIGMLATAILSLVGTIITIIVVLATRGGK